MGDPGLTGLAGSLTKAMGAMAGVADMIGKVRGGVSGLLVLHTT